MPTKTKQCETYAETCGREPFDWNKFLRPGRREPSEKEWSKARRLSGRWATCACGTQCSIIPRKNDWEYGAPIDTRLRQLGYSFYTQISKRNAPRARLILAKIEKRSGEILLKLRSKAVKK